jgi:hypothetical protein
MPTRRAAHRRGLHADRHAKCLIKNGYASVTLAPMHSDAPNFFPARLLFRSAMPSSVHGMSGRSLEWCLPVTLDRGRDSNVRVEVQP